VSVRTRRATAVDVPFLSWVVLAASRSHLSRGAWDLVMPDSETARRTLVATVLNARPSWCHYANFRISEVRGEPAAALSGYPASGEGLAPPQTIFAEVAQKLGWSHEDLATTYGRMKPLIGCMPEEDPAGWTLEWVATDPDFRRRGLVCRLLDEELDAVRRRGYHAAQLLIFIGNEPAQRAYEKVGFRVVDEVRTPEFEAALGCPGIARMEIPL
jgi:ribosomal protein S18 acetylase RimI-like enzyme